MYLLGVTLCLLWFFIRVPHYLVTLFFALVYALWYLDGKEYTGERRWPWFRSLRIWRLFSPVDYVFPHRTDMMKTRGRRLFVFIPCWTPMPLVWGVGLHGGRINFSAPTHYVVPPPYMWVPLLRDVLMWSGAITYSSFNAKHSLQGVLLDLLNSGRSVCYAPSNFTSHGEEEQEQAKEEEKEDDDLENGKVKPKPNAFVSTRFPTDDLLAFCISERVQLVPVVVQHEPERYRIPQNPWLQSVQRFFLRQIHCALPLCFWMRLYAPRKPPLLCVQFGPIMNCERYKEANLLKAALEDNVSGTVLTQHGDKEIKGI